MNVSAVSLRDYQSLILKFLVRVAGLLVQYNYAFYDIVRDSKPFMLDLFQSWEI